MEKCRAVAAACSQKMQSEEFLVQIDEKVKTLPVEQKQGALMELIVPLHIDLMKPYGYEGEDGYIKLQAAMMKYMGDPGIMSNMQAAMYAVTLRADLPTGPPSQ